MPEELVNVPELVQLPATVKLPVLEATNVVFAAIVRTPFTSKIGSQVSAVIIIPVLVPFPKVR